MPVLAISSLAFAFEFHSRDTLAVRFAQALHADFVLQQSMLSDAQHLSSFVREPSYRGVTVSFGKQNTIECEALANRTSSALLPVADHSVMLV
jgi:hypothetical protein